MGTSADQLEAAVVEGANITGWGADPEEATLAVTDILYSPSMPPLPSPLQGVLPTPPSIPAYTPSREGACYIRRTTTTVEPGRERLDNEVMDTDSDEARRLVDAVGRQKWPFHLGRTVAAIRGQFPRMDERTLKYRVRLIIMSWKALPGMNAVAIARASLRAPQDREAGALNQSERERRTQAFAPDLLCAIHDSRMDY